MKLSIIDKKRVKKEGETVDRVIFPCLFIIKQFYDLKSYTNVLLFHNKQNNQNIF